MCCNLEKLCIHNHICDYSLYLWSVESMASFVLLLINCSLCPMQTNKAKVVLNTQVLTAQHSPCKEHSAPYKHSEFPSALAEATENCTDQNSMQTCLTNSSLLTLHCPVLAAAGKMRQQFTAEITQVLCAQNTLNLCKD